MNQTSMTTMTKVTTTLHNNWLETPGYKEAFDALEAEFVQASQLLEAQTKSETPQILPAKPSNSGE
jgi:hypothetical protein